MPPDTFLTELRAGDDCAPLGSSWDHKSSKLALQEWNAVGKVAVERVVDRDHAFSVEVERQHCSEGEPCHPVAWQTLAAHTEPQHRRCFCRVSPHRASANFHDLASPLRKESRGVFV